MILAQIKQKQVVPESVVLGEYFTFPILRIMLENVFTKDKDEVVGQTIKARTLKNKTYRPNQSAVIDFYFAQTQGFDIGDFDVLKDTINIGIAIEVITRAGAYYSFGEGRWQGKEKMLEAFRQDVGMKDQLVAAVEKHYGVAR